MTSAAFQRRLILIWALVLFTVAVFFVSNMLIGSEDNFVNEEIFYGTEQRRTIFGRVRPAKSKDVGILAIIDENSLEKDYFFALESMKCYSALQGYDFRVERVSKNWTDVCGHQDFMFKRHCIAAHLIDDHEWTLVIDADVGVINPSKLIETWIDERFDVILYDRFYNWEVATGSYLVRRSQFGKEFLLDFADYEKKLPKSFHGTDNAAIHAYLVDLFAPYAESEMNGCHRIWERSKTFVEVFQFEACVRAIIGAQREFPPKVKIVPKGSAWLRDSWLTDSRWSAESDFMMHGWQLRRLLDPFGTKTRRAKFSWETPFTQPLDLAECRAGRSTWHYNAALIRPAEDIKQQLEKVRRNVTGMFWKSAGTIATYFGD